MVKKLAALAGSAVMLLGAAVPALARYRTSKSDVTVTNVGNAYQINSVSASSNTGYNSLFGKSGWMMTGNASTKAGVFSYANDFTTRVKAPCNCVDDVTVTNVGTAYQTTNVGASSNTGYNHYAGWWLGGVSTGDAGAVSGAESWANIYTTMIGGIAQ